MKLLKDELYLGRKPEEEEDPEPPQEPNGGRY